MIQYVYVYMHTYTYTYTYRHTWGVDTRIGRQRICTRKIGQNTLYVTLCAQHTSLENATSDRCAHNTTLGICNR